MANRQPASAANAPSTRDLPETAERGLRRGQTAPLQVPLTAAFIGLLLVRETAWGEDATELDATAGDGSAGGDLPPAGADAAAAGQAFALGDGARLALAGGDAAARAAAVAAGDGRLFGLGETTIDGALASSFRLGPNGAPLNVTLEGLSLNIGPMTFGAAGEVPGEAELTSVEDGNYSGLGYLAQIEAFQLGTAGDDLLIGTDGNDYISGGDGDDTIYGRAGDDVLHGDAGNDRVFGEEGNDLVFGDSGDDLVDGGDGSDDIFGGTGDDKLIGGGSDDAGIDRLYGGFGADTYILNSVTDDPDELQLEPLAGVDYGFTDPGLFENDVDQAVVTARFIDSFQRETPIFVFSDSYGELAPTAALDKVFIPKGVDDLQLEGSWNAEIYGGAGANRLVGNAGDNVIRGFAGDDILDGRGGTNRLEGGAGHDTYVVDARVEGLDRIADSDRADALNANTLRFVGVDRADLAIARDGDAVTFSIDGVLRARVVDYTADGPVFHVETDDASFQLLGTNHAPRLADTLADSWAVEVGAIDQYTIPAPLFVDVDFNDTVTVAASLEGGVPLPSWLAFDATAGQFFVAPGQDAVGSHVIELTATDSQGAMTSTSFRLDVVDPAGGDQPPREPTAPPSWEVAEDSTRSFTLTPTVFADIDIDDIVAMTALTADGSPLPAWLDFDPATGRFTAAPGNDDTYALTVRVTATDGGGARDSVDLRIAATQTNDAPVAATGAFTRGATEDVAFSWTVPQNLFTDVDPNAGLELLVDPAQLPGWLTYDPATRTFAGTPGEGDAGSFDITLAARDAAGAVASARLGIDVRGVNDAPTAANVPDAVQYLSAQDLTAAGPYTWRVPADLFADPDPGDTLTFQARLATGEPLPSWLSFDGETGTFATDRPSRDLDPFEVEIAATDSAGARAYATVTLDLNVFGNRAPLVAGADGTVALDAFEDQALAWAPQPTWFVEEDGDPLRFEATLADGSPLPAWLKVDPATGALSGAPSGADVADGPLLIDLWAVDPFGARGGAYRQVDGEWRHVEEPIRVELDLHPNRAPEWTQPVETQRVVEDRTTIIELPADAVRDADGDALVLSATAADGSPLPEWLAFDAASRQFVAIPLAGDPKDSPAVISVRVTAAEDRPDGAAASTVFDIAVDAVNDAPILVEPGADMLVGVEGQTYRWQVPHGVFTDEEGGSLSYDARLARGGQDAPLPAWLMLDGDTGSFVSDDPTPVAGDGHRTVVELGADGAPVRWAHYDLRVSAIDAAGRASEETLDLTFKVRAANDAPTIQGEIATQSVLQDEAFGLAVPAGLFSDPDGDALTLTASLADGAPLPNWLTFANGQFAGTPSQADVGQLNVRLTATDPAGAAASTVFALTVDDVNDVPLVVQPYADGALREGQVLELLPSVHFSDPDGDALTLEVEQAGGDALPDWLAFDPTSNRLEVVPSAGAAAFAHEQFNTIELVIRAGDGEASAATTMSLEIRALPDLLDTPPEVISAFEDEALVGAALSGRFTDDPTAVLAATLVDGEAWPGWLTFDAATGSFHGTPGNADVGVVELAVTARDESGHTDVETFALVVENTNDAPTVARTLADVVVAEGEAFRIDLPADLFADADAVHGDVLTLSAAEAPSWLHFDASARAFIDVAPDVARDTTHTITVRATDAAGATAETSFDLRIEHTNRAPQVAATPAPSAAVEEQRFEWTLPANTFGDPDGDRLTLTAASADGSPLPAWLTFDPATRLFAGTPGDADPGAYNIKVTATDPAGQSASTTLRFDVANVHDAPTVAGTVADVRVDGGEAVAFSLPLDLFADADFAVDDAVYDERLVLSADGLPAWLSFDAATGAFSAASAPDVAAAETVTVTVRATDASNRSVETAFDLTVVPSNYAPVVGQASLAPVAQEDQAFAWQLPAATFEDPDGDALTFGARLADGTALPAWLTFDAASGTFLGTPGDADPGVVAIAVTATDPDGRSATAVFDLAVANVNDAPVASATIGDQAVARGAAIAAIDASEFFADADAFLGDQVTYAASLADGGPLPAGLLFDGTTLSGAPMEAGTYALRLSTRDAAGSEAAQTFALTVEAPALPADPFALAADGTISPDVVAGLPLHSATPTFSSGTYYYAAGEEYWKVPEIDYFRYSQKPVFTEPNIQILGDRKAAMLGNDGDNVMLGNDGANIVVGQDGDDVLSGADGDDELYGGAGDDVLAGGLGRDTLAGGAGNDRYEIGGLQDGFVDYVHDADGHNTIDLDGVTAGEVSFGMAGDDLFIAVDRGAGASDAVGVRDFADAGSAFDVEVDDAVVSNAALLAAVEEMRQAFDQGERVPLEDVLDGYLGARAGGSAAPPDPLAAFMPAAEDAGAEATPDLAGAGLPPSLLPAEGAWVMPDGLATTHHEAVSGIASKSANEEEPVYA